MMSDYSEKVKHKGKTVEENSWKNHSKEKAMKNFKTHKKLNHFKCPKFYRTYCDLVVLVVLVHTILELVTFASCSEFRKLSYNTRNSSSNVSGIPEEHSVKLRSPVVGDFPAYPFSYLSDKVDTHKQAPQRLIALGNTSSSSKMSSDTVAKDAEDQQEPDLVKLQEIVRQGLGLQSLPDASKMNISHREYITKYNEYLDLVRSRKRRKSTDDPEPDRTLVSYSQNATETSQYFRRQKRSLHSSDVVYVRFPITIDNDSESDVDEANLRLLLVTKQAEHHSSPDHHRNHRMHHREDTKTLTLKVYQLIEPYGRIWLDSKEVDVDATNNSTSRWLEFDVTKAVKGWLAGKQANLGLEIHCDKCYHHGAHIVEDLSINTDPESNPVLNIIGSFGTHREKRSRQHHHFMQSARRKARKTDCYKENQKCCRHTMEVVFKEIKGFEFIIQPKVFDAGYCRGKCPPRYNPAHHHAFLQSLIWKQDRNKAPRPCCAPSKLVELEVLHVDENDNKKLKVSTWTDMRVLECACS